MARQKELEEQYAKEKEAKRQAEALKETELSGDELRFFEGKGKHIPDDPKKVEEMLESMPLFATKAVRLLPPSLPLLALHQYKSGLVQPFSECYPFLGSRGH
jgi:hypothetical protein